MTQRSNEWHDASEWLIDNKCVSCEEALRCEMDCEYCNDLNTSLEKFIKEIKKDTLEKLLPLFQEEVRQWAGGGYEGELAIESCIDIVKKKLASCS